MKLFSLFNSAPVRSPRSAGFTLPEMMLALAATSLFAAAVFMLYNSGPNAAGADIEQSNVQTLSQNAYSAYGPLGNYAGVTIQNAITDGVVPPNMISGSGSSATATSVWGTPVTLSSVPAGPDGLADVGLAINYAGVPRGACPVLIDGLAENMWDIQVNGNSVMVDVSAASRGFIIRSGGGGQQVQSQFHILDMDAARDACLTSGKDGVDPQVTFVRYDPTVGSQLVAGADSNNVLWTSGKGGGGVIKGGGEIIPTDGGDDTTPVIPPIIGQK